MQNEDTVTAYANAEPKKQEQTLPGTEKALEPFAEHTKLEKWDENGKPYLEEYVGSGKLKGKKIIITGGDSGIGKAVALQAAREGADLTINYLPEEQEDADDVKKRVEQEGRECLLVPADLMEDANCKKVVDEHVKKYGRIDVLVNNASKQIQCKDLADIEPDNVRSTFKSNIVAMIVLTKFALPHMRRGSTIVNSASVTAYKGSAGMLDYSATKGAICTFTRSLAMQLMPKGIRVNAVAPGPVYTPLQPASRSGEQMEGWGIGDIPLHGRVAQPAELGPSYIFLASADSNAMTGNTIHINSGQWVGS
ncbi:NAD(P)-binding protein [Cystobasidium minutum MCA 4210]|uniref:NAD(P)-binding protein n=1 Tax=Cystobasidium minutum MCA 4210 TaxID=1397322 RepID=UPI0034CF7FD0|eukprot:jgi/Rhomi1/206490/MIX7319_11198_78